MQITIHTDELNAEQLGYLEAIIRVRREGLMPYTSEDQKGGVTEPVEEAPTEEPINDKPKRTRRTKAEIEAEINQEAEETSEVVKEEIVAPSTVFLTLSDIKTKAQDMVQRVSRDAVKIAINKYADKISDVKESDYSALMADFEALEG